MFEAIVVFSRAGLFQTTIAAKEVHSREHARKLWPFVTSTVPRQQLTWISPSVENGKVRRRSHFRVLPDTRNLSLKDLFAEEEEKRYRATQESEEHHRAKQLIAEALKRRLKQGLAMPWYFADPNASDFHFAGNLLLGAEEVICEHPVKTSFDCSYRLDVAVLSRTIHKTPILLGGVEIELGHQFDGRKALIGKSQAFVLISIDITGLGLEELTPDWADRVLTDTRHTAKEGERKTYIYVHDVLYPLYVQIPPTILESTRHQYVVFAPEEDLVKLRDLIKLLHSALQMPERAIETTIVNAKSAQAEKMLQNLGDIVGPDWAQINGKQCLKISLNRPRAFDESEHLAHLAIAKLLLVHSDSLVGYKYDMYLRNNDPADDIWRDGPWNRELGKFEKHRILPKRLAEPRSRILQVLSSLQG